MTKHTEVESRPITAQGWTIVAIEASTYSAMAVAGRVVATARREPIALIVRGPAGERHFDLAGSELH